MGYTPVVIGETSELRREVEVLLDGGRPELISQRINALTSRAAEAGYLPTSGAEMEFSFVKDPTALHGPLVLDQDALYLEVVEEVQGTSEAVAYPKGCVLPPSAFRTPLMLNERINNTYNCEQEGVSEVRTAPGTWRETVERYWRAISAIGTVAARNGCMGLLHATHFSAGVMQLEGDPGESPMLSFCSPEGGEYLGLFQNNMRALRPLQLDAGLANGIVVDEAFPSKDAVTAVHMVRLESRKPTIGLADPRVDALAAAGAVCQLVENDTSGNVLKSLKRCWSIDTFRAANWLATTFVHNVLFNEKANGFITPAVFDADGRAPNAQKKLDELVSQLTNGQLTSYVGKGGQVFKDAVSALRYKQGEIVVDQSSPYVGVLQKIANNIAIAPSTLYYRVLPEVFMDSPELHARRRASLARSPVVRELLGSVLESLPPVSEATARRDILIQSQMIAA